MTVELYTVAPAKLSDADAWTIRGLRRRYHPGEEGFIGPHITLLFGWSGLKPDAYIRHVQELAQSFKPFLVTLTEAVAPIEQEIHKNYVYLTAPGSDAQLRTMHAALYGGPMAPALKRDLEYVPHMTVGCLHDRQSAAELAETLNSKGVKIDVPIDGLEVYAKTDRGYRLLKEIAL